MTSHVVERFLNSVSDVIDVIDAAGCDCNPAVLLVASFTAVVVTSFTAKLTVIIASFAASLLILSLSNGFVRVSRRLASAVLYVALFSLVALAPLLLEGRVYLYMIYLLRALGATLLLLTVVSVLGWRGLSDAAQELGVPAIARLVTTHMRLVSTLIKDASKILIGREARTFRRVGLKDLPVYTSAVGDSIIRSCERGRRLALAVEARTFGGVRGSRRSVSRLTRVDVLMLFAAVAVVAMQFLEGV